MGYTVEELSYENPGYDLQAVKEEKILFVEVNGHLGRATIVDLTVREFKDYVEKSSNTAMGRRELWNCEELSAETTKAIILTRYDTIPEEGLDVSA